MAVQKTIDYKSIAIQATITAVVFAVVNKLIKPAKGLGVPEKMMLNLSLERMSQFADPITIANVNNKAFLKDNLGTLNENDPEVFKNGNKTSIGNCAFVALHSEHECARTKAMKMIEGYKKYAL